MTLPRQPAHAQLAARALVAVSLAIAAATTAPGAGAQIANAAAPEPLLGPVMGPTLPPAPVVAPAPAPAPAKAPAPAAGAANREWLRNGAAPKKAAAPAPAPSRPWRVILMSALVVGLGGTAVYMQRKRRVVVKTVRSDLVLLTSTRVGAKAQVVVVSVSGRKLLLGVTDAQISSLGWLEADAEPELAARGAERALFDPAEPAAVSPPRQTSLLRGAAEAPVSSPKRFRDVLRGALGRPDVAAIEDAAVTLARATEDVVVTRGSRAKEELAPSRVAAPAGAPEMVDIEGQARGLVLRLQKRG